MSVIVKGMKMPETCEECTYQTKGACFASGVNKGTITIRRMDKDRPDWCPLVEIPETCETCRYSFRPDEHCENCVDTDSKWEPWWEDER